MYDGYTYSDSSDSGPIHPSRESRSKKHNNQPQEPNGVGKAILAFVIAIFVVPFILVAIVLIAYIPTVNRWIDKSVEQNDIDYTKAKTLDADEQRIMARLLAAYYDDDVSALGITRDDCELIDTTARKIDDTGFDYFTHDICGDKELEYYIVQSSGTMYFDFIHEGEYLELKLVNNLSKISDVEFRPEPRYTDMVNAIKIVGD